MHTEFEHTWPTPQAIPHPPQLAPSVAVVAQYAAPPSGVQSCWPLTHCETQVPLEQTCPMPQTVPHVPQFAPSALVFAQYAAPPSGVQSVCPLMQFETHSLPEHASCGPHAWPQVPQFALSVIGSTQEPLQFVRPCWQLSVQAAFEQTSPEGHV